MKFVRLATLYFSPPPTDLKARDFSIGDVRVTLRDTRTETGPAPILAIAETEIPDRLPVNTENQIELPEETVTSAQRAIEIVANVVAVCDRAKRSISTPNPPAALIPADDETRRWLDSTAGVAVQAAGVPASPGTLELDNRVMEMLVDRVDGAALLAEALSHDHATGKFHELIRLFERAFRLGPHSLVEPLAAFLATGPFGYTRKEVERWIELRHPATHADRRPGFVLEADIQPIIQRGRSSAVLSTPATRRSPSPRRQSSTSSASWMPSRSSSS